MLFYLSVSRNLISEEAALVLKENPIFARPERRKP